MRTISNSQPIDETNAAVSALTTTVSTQAATLSQVQGTTTSCAVDCARTVIYSDSFVEFAYEGSSGRRQPTFTLLSGWDGWADTSIWVLQDQGGSQSTNSYDSDDVSAAQNTELYFSSSGTYASTYDVVSTGSNAYGSLTTCTLTPEDNSYASMPTYRLVGYWGQSALSGGNVLWHVRKY